MNDYQRSRNKRIEKHLKKHKKRSFYIKAAIIFFSAMLIMTINPIMQVLGITAILSTATYSMAQVSKNKYTTKRVREKPLSKSIERKKERKLLAEQKKQEENQCLLKDELFYKEMERDLKKRDKLKYYDKSAERRLKQEQEDSLSKTEKMLES